jgi:hypothetical protein
MATKSAKSELFLGDLPQQDGADKPQSPILSQFLEVLLVRLKRASGGQPNDAIFSQAGLDGKRFYEALNKNASLPLASIGNLVALIEDPMEQAAWMQDAQFAILARRAGWHNSLAAIYRASPMRLYSGYAIGTYSNDSSSYWTELLFRLFKELGVPITPIDRLDIQWARQALIERPRSVVGEHAALRHAIILFNTYINTQSITAKNAVAALELAYAVLILAAQINDARLGGEVTDYIVNNLRSQMHDGVEVAVCDRIIHSSRATLSRQKRSGLDETDIPTERDIWTARAVENWRLEARERQFAQDYPGIGRALTGAWFQRISTLMGRNARPVDIADAVKYHDAAGFALSGAHETPVALEASLKSTCFTAIHWSDMQADFLLYDAGAEPLKSNDIPCYFDPGRAIDICQAALSVFDPNEHSADTAFASVRLTRAKAIILRQGRLPFTQWPGKQREEYIQRRNEARKAFADLRMDWKLRPLARFEEQHGFVSWEQCQPRLGVK